jgi:hypothetical protein
VLPQPLCPADTFYTQTSDSLPTTVAATSAGCLHDKQHSLRFFLLTTRHLLPPALTALSVWFVSHRFYTPTGGNIVFAGADMPVVPQLQAAWSLLESVTGAQLCNTAATFPAYRTGHICSYLCFTSAAVDVTNNQCWIVPDQTAPAGSSSCPASFT